MLTRYLRKLRQKCDWCRELWDTFTPWVQISGFIIVCAFTSGGYFNQFSALAKTSEQHEQRIQNLEDEFIRINQKLDDIISYQQHKR